MASDVTAGGAGADSKNWLCTKCLTINEDALATCGNIACQRKRSLFGVKPGETLRDRSQAQVRRYDLSDDDLVACDEVVRNKRKRSPASPGPGRMQSAVHSLIRYFIE